MKKLIIWMSFALVIIPILFVLGFFAYDNFQVQACTNFKPIIKPLVIDKNYVIDGVSDGNLGLKVSGTGDLKSKSVSNSGIGYSYCSLALHSVGYNFIYKGKQIEFRQDSKLIPRDLESVVTNLYGNKIYDFEEIFKEKILNTFSRFSKNKYELLYYKEDLARPMILSSENELYTLDILDKLVPQLPIIYSTNDTDLIKVTDLRQNQAGQFFIKLSISDSTMDALNRGVYFSDPSLRSLWSNGSNEFCFEKYSDYSKFDENNKSYEAFPGQYDNTIFPMDLVACTNSAREIDRLNQPPK